MRDESQVLNAMAAAFATRLTDKVETAVLACLGHDPDQSLSSLAAKTKASRSAILRALNDLEYDGYLGRVARPGNGNNPYQLKYAERDFREPSFRTGRVRK
ncbi:MarR family transcriptional regulator [Sphingobium yanoikuyae]|jgi:DNA-binding MarR family transcriptional regulator|uniref:MarR family transcriptional regulator n=1 Tax=Sphingobium yanoikuyae TaxID=13690 RepID=UPI003B8FFB08